MGKIIVGPNEDYQERQTELIESKKDSSSEPQIQYIEKPVEIIVEKEVFIDRPIEVIKEIIIEQPIEVIKEVFIEKPVEIIKECVKIVEVEKEIPVEIIKIKYVDKLKEVTPFEIKVILGIQFLVIAALVYKLL